MMICGVHQKPSPCPETGWEALVSLDCPATIKVDNSGELKKYKF